MTALRATGLSVGVNGTTLLHDIDLAVEPGEWLSVIGPNGAGKSTLLRALAGVADSTGRVDIFERNATEFGRREAARTIAWVPQTPSIPPGFRVIDYVLLGRTPHLHPLAFESRHDIDVAQAVLHDLDLTSLADRVVETLSGGERQRTVIARALAQEAPIILLDEPTSALDLGHQQDVLGLLDQLRQAGDRTIVTTMHDLTLAGQYADRLVLLADGRIAATGSAIEVLTEDNLRTHYRARVRVTYEGDAVLVVPRLDQQHSATTCSAIESSATTGSATPEGTNGH